MAKSRLYLDIDGCLNAFWSTKIWNVHSAGVTERREGIAPVFNDRGDQVDVAGPEYTMRWNSRLIDELNALDVDLVWCTTWRSDALRVGKLMGISIPGQRVLHPLSGVTEFPSIHWKYKAILADQEAHPSPFICVDDEWSFTPSPVQLRLAELGGLVVSPDPNSGISPEEIHNIQTYLFTFN